MDQDNPYEAGVAPVHMGMTGEAGPLGPVPVEIGPILQRSWDLLIANVGVVAGSFLIPLAISMPFVAVVAGMNVLAAGDEDLALIASIGTLLVYAVLIPVMLVLYLGIIRIYTHLVRGLPASIGMLASSINRAPAGLLVFFATGIAVGVGSLMCIVPGVLLALALQFAPFLLIDQERGPIESLSESWSLAWPHLLTVFLMELLLGVGSFVAICATCGLGYFVAVPFGFMARAVMYHAMLGAGGRV